MAADGFGVEGPSISGEGRSAVVMRYSNADCDIEMGMKDERWSWEEDQDEDDNGDDRTAKDSRFIGQCDIRKAHRITPFSWAGYGEK